MTGHARIQRIRYRNLNKADKEQSSAITRCDKLIEEFNYRNERYLEILKALIDELAKTQMPTLSQIKYVDNFTKFSDGWMTHDPELHVEMFHKLRLYTNRNTLYNEDEETY